MNFYEINNTTTTKTTKKGRRRNFPRKVGYEKSFTLEFFQ
jgi:hypothetical protein